MDHLYNQRSTNKLTFLFFIVFNQWLLQLPLVYSDWLSIGKLHSSLSSTIGPRICDQMSLKSKQKEICKTHPDVMASVSEGAMKGIAECQYQFLNERWNCSTSEKGQAVFGKVINRGSREASFVHAITAAGVMYEVTRACSRGDIGACSCDLHKRGEGRDGKGKFQWGGCSDDLGYSARFVSDFVDASEVNVRDARASMNLHNNRAGRKAVKKFMKRQCKCHGNTGACPLRTCWDAMGDFRLTSDYIKVKYDNAIHVMVTQNGPNESQLIPTEKKKSLTRNDLVYLEQSPDYCVRDTKKGIFGTEGRECNLTSRGSDGCKTLCCGRGHNTKTITRKFKCKCMFHWCCEVRCEECKQIIDIHTCKGETDELDIATSSGSIDSTTKIMSTTTKKSRRRGGKGRKRDRTRKGRKKGKKARSKREIETGNFRNSNEVSMDDSNEEKSNLRRPRRRKKFAGRETNRNFAKTITR